MREITFRGLIIGFIFTILFTAANTYLGLKVGLTFATSIPAAIISMSIFRVLKHGSILENNIVQTMVSASSTITAMVFILPALVILGFWQGFPFWQTFLLGSIGGTLGMLFSVPLRRALVVNSNLSYPEGRAAAEVLQVGHTDTSDSKEQLGHPLKDLSIAAIFSFIFNLCSNSFRLFANSTDYFVKFAGMVSGLGFQFSFALVGAGYLVGLITCLSVVLGIIISWGVAVPILSLHHAHTAMSVADIAMTTWTKHVRFIGAGVIGIGSIWIIILLIKPIVTAVQSSFNTAIKKRLNQHDDIPLHERDINIIWVLSSVFLLTLLLIAVIAYFIHLTHVPYSAGTTTTITVLATLLILVISFFASVACGYMAGLIGSSYSPISGVVIIATIILALFFSYLLNNMHNNLTTAQLEHFAIGLTIFVTTASVAAAGIANDTLQDFKTGQLVGATPWKQQVVLIFGTIVGAATIAPVLNQLYHAYGFVGALPNPHMDPKQALTAPQATLMAAIAKGIISHHMHWNMLLIGVGIGVAILLINALFFTPKKLPQISLIAVGLGIYLPSSLALPVICGGVLSYLVKRKLLPNNHYRATIERCGVLLACGLIVGEAIFGIINSGIISVTGKENILALTGKNFSPIALVLSVVIFIFAFISFYHYVKRMKVSLENKE
ncbi:MAG: oligopeptide transporter, OPT family [Pseudomonadota bacterium]